jgi:cytochrome d ubiquinol oxidase subunit II
MHGAVFLQLKTEGDINQRCKSGHRFCNNDFGHFALGIWVANIDGYQISRSLPNAPSNPLAKTVSTGPGLWLKNAHCPVWVVPGLAFCRCGDHRAVKNRPLGWHYSFHWYDFVILTAGVSMFRS